MAVVGISNKDPETQILLAVAKELGKSDSGLTIKSYIPDDATALAQQKILGTVLNEGAHAVCILSNDPVAIQPQIEKLNTAGKEVVLLKRDMPTSGRAAFCGPLDSALGELTARACKEVMPPDRSTVILVHAGIDHPIYGNRLVGFEHELALIGELEIFKDLNCEANPIVAQRQVRRESRLYPRTGCFAMLGDWAMRGIQKSERITPAESKTVVCNDSPELHSLMRAGQIDALICFDIRKCAEEGLAAAIRLSSSSTDEPMDRIIIEPFIVTRNEIGEHENRWKKWGETSLRIESTDSKNES